MRSWFVGIAASPARLVLPLDGHGALAPLAAADNRRERPERPASGGPRRPGIAVTRAGETMMRTVAVFVGHEV